MNAAHAQTVATTVGLLASVALLVSVWGDGALPVALALVAVASLGYSLVVLTVRRRTSRPRRDPAHTR